MANAEKVLQASELSGGILAKRSPKMPPVGRHLGFKVTVFGLAAARAGGCNGTALPRRDREVPKAPYEIRVFALSPFTHTT